MPKLGRDILGIGVFLLIEEPKIWEGFLKAFGSRGWWETGLPPPNLEITYFRFVGKIATKKNKRFLRDMVVNRFRGLIRLQRIYNF